MKNLNTKICSTVSKTGLCTCILNAKEKVYKTFGLKEQSKINVNNTLVIYKIECSECPRFYSSRNK